MDIQKEREAFEESFKIKWEIGHHILKMVKFIEDSQDYEPVNAVKQMSDEYYWVLALNTGWWAWQAAKAQAVPEWISVKNSLPPENTLVLGMSQTPCNIFNTYNVMALDEFEEADVTHWMPLPDAPQEPK